MEHKLSGIELVLTDVDGTIVVDRQHEPSPRVVETIARLQSAGVHIAIASARPPGLAEAIVRNLGLRGPQIIDGGASIYDFDTQETIWKSWLDLERLRKVSAIVMEYSHIIDCFPELKMVDVTDFSLRDISEEAPYVYGRVQKHQLEAFSDRLKSIDKLHASVVATHGNEFSVQVCDIAGSKRHGAEELQRILGVTPARSLAIGDHDNDVALFAAADTKVAMGNATEKLKNLATYVTTGVEEDGWVQAMDKFVLTYKQ